MSDFIPVQNVVSDHGSLPDSNTSEAILFGSAYSWIKSALWVWDEMEDYLINKADQLEGMLIDREWSYDTMVRNRYLVFSRSPQVNEVDHLKDLFTLRQLIKTVAGLRKIDEYRKQNVSWARMQGIREYVGGMAGRGISESEWKAATADYSNAPITYDYVHGLTPDKLPGSDIDWADAMRDLMGDRDYDAMISRIFGDDVPEDDDRDGWPDAGEDSDQMDGDEATAEEDEGDDISGEGTPNIPEEERRESVDAPSTGPEEERDWLSEGLAVMFDDPFDAALDIAEEVYDDCRLASEWWASSDYDDRAIIDAFIEGAAPLGAEAMPRCSLASCPSTRTPSPI